jgi:hypothetical protein
MTYESFNLSSLGSVISAGHDTADLASMSGANDRAILRKDEDAASPTRGQPLDGAFLFSRREIASERMEKGFDADGRVLDLGTSKLAYNGLYLAE